MRESLFLALFAVAFPWLLLAVLFTRHLLHGVKCWPFLLAIIAIFTVIFYSMELYVSVESLYPKNVRELKTRYSGACTLENVWNIAVEYNSKFIFTYGKPIPKPRQFLIEINGMDPLCNFSRIFTSRLAAVAGTGACEDFALGLTALLRDAFGCETRIVIFENVDHAMPEAMVNGTWYVFDISYTTPKEPIKAYDYAKYLYEFNAQLASKIKGVKDLYTHEDLSVEHGFTASKQPGSSGIYVKYKLRYKIISKH